MMRSSSGGSSSTTTSCQDCGNKAKRDCSHMRCRTCCKSRGFQCSTHVKSTWVPVAKRRQKQHQHLSSTIDHHYHQYHQYHHHHHHLPLPLSLSNIHYHSSPTSTGQEGGNNFPAEVNSLAIFRCIRVSSEDNDVDQYAYQTSITIGGHVFKGVLYDQGSTTANCGGESSSAATVTSNNRQFNIMTTSTAVAATHPSGGGGGGGGASYVYHPPSLYSTHGFNAFLPGMQFFPHPRP